MLMHAVLSGSADAVKVLLAAGAEILTLDAVRSLFLVFVFLVFVGAADSFVLCS